MKRFRSFFSKLRDKYRLVIINETSFEEKLAWRLSRWNVLMIGATLCVLISLILLAVIILTPLKTMIPGYSDNTTKKNAKTAELRSAELKEKQELNEAYIFNIKQVLEGNLSADSVKVMPESQGKYDNLDYNISKEDSLLRLEVEEKERYNINDNSMHKTDLDMLLGTMNFYSPVKGDVSHSYSPGSNHLGVDVIAPANEAIKSIMDGVVVLSTWSAEEGYVITVQHANNLVSIYKHNSSLLKKTGDHVQVGESIAIIGNSGELTTGPHLHFELWHNGIAIDPLEYINFN